MADLGSVMAELESLGTAQNRKVYARHGVSAAMFGVSYANLDALRKKLGTDHDLALALWATGNHDARVLATKIADPARADESLLDAWAQDLDNYVVTDAFSAYAVQPTGAAARSERWRDDDRQWVSRAGWTLATLLAQGDAEEPGDAWFSSLLPTIEAEIHQRPNWVRAAMNLTLIAIGTRSDEMEQACVAAARRIGKVEVDHGETGCKTPDAEPYLRKARERRRKKQEKAAAKGRAGTTAVGRTCGG